MSRGNAKQAIFLDHVDYRRYLGLLATTAERFDVRCAAYCLMRNHVHLLLQPRDLPLWRLMQQLNSTYCQWFNRRHNRVGHVLQGRYRSLLVDSPAYFLRVLRYIVRNPVASGHVTAPADWRWSSYRATAGLSEVPAFLDLRQLWKVLGVEHASVGAERFVTYIADAVDDELALDRLLMGSKDFLARCDPLLEPHRHVSDFVLAERFAARPTLAELLPLSGAARNRAVRRAFYEYRYTLREIAAHLDRPVGTVWSWIRRAKRAGSDLDFRKTPPAKPARSENRDLTPGSNGR
jgi:REP element-mobilizing transposase RayT